MIVADGMANNGGLLHSIEALNGELDEAVSSYRFFGLHGVADVVAEISRRLVKYESVSDESALDALESEADDRYFAIAGGDILFEAFEATFALRPEMFSPAEVEGVQLVSRKTDKLEGAVRTFISGSTRLSVVDGLGFCVLGW